MRRPCRSPIGLLSAVAAALLQAGCVTHTVESRAYQTEVRASVPGAVARPRGGGHGAEAPVIALPGVVSSGLELRQPDCTLPGAVMGTGVLMMVSSAAVTFGGFFLASVNDGGSSGGGLGMLIGGVALGLVGMAATIGGASAWVTCRDEAKDPPIVGTRPTTVVVERPGYRPQSVVVEHPAATIDVILSPAWRVSTSSASLDVYATSDERRPGLHALGRRVATTLAAQQGLGAGAVVEGSPATEGAARALAVRVFTVPTTGPTPRCLVRVERDGLRAAEREGGCDEAGLAAAAEQAALDALRGSP